MTYEDAMMGGKVYLYGRGIGEIMNYHNTEALVLFSDTSRPEWINLLLLTAIENNEEDDD